MPKFTDSMGRDWIVKLNVGLVEQVQEDTDVNLDSLLETPEKFASILAQTPKKLVQILWVLCEDQAAEYGVDPKQFGFLFDRDLLDKASQAFLEAVLLFYPRSVAGRTVAGKLPQLLAKMDQAIEKDVNSRLDKVLSDTVIVSPE